MSKPAVLVFIDWYAPGFKAGGPVRSLVNMVDHLRDRINLYIVTRDTDYTETVPYTGVIPDQWTTLPGGEHVWYASAQRVDSATWERLLHERAWDAVYINGMYSRWSGIMPLWLLRGTPQRRIVAVRGMLAHGMMRHGAVKKRLFLAAMRALGCYSGVVFQATNTSEVEDVKRWIGPRTVTLARCDNDFRVGGAYRFVYRNPDGFEFEWTATQNESWGLTIVEAVVPMLDKVGIKVKIKPVEGSVLSEVIRKGEFQAFIWSLQTGPDPQAAMRCFLSTIPVSACNYTSFKNADFDKTFAEAAATDDLAKKTELLKKANNIVYEQAPMWFFNYNKAVMAYQPWLHGLQPNATELALQYYEDLWVDETSPAK